MQIYSPYFETLHDETKPTGRLGRGTHYSVLRAVVWHDEKRNPLSQAHNLDFAIIWDEDHDVRVIGAAEDLYVRGWLSSAVFVGEKKAVLTFLMPSELQRWLSDARFEEWSLQLEDLMQSYEDDPWYSRFGYASDLDVGIIDDSDEKVGLYLSTIAMLWNLGIKPILI